MKRGGRRELKKRTTTKLKEGWRYSLRALGLLRKELNPNNAFSKPNNTKNFHSYFL